MAANDQVINGWSPVPVNPSQIFGGKPYINKPGPLLVEDLDFPSENSVVSSVQKYAQQHLPGPTYNHSMRVCYYASAIVQQQFPDQSPFSSVTLALTCLLHDLGTTQENMSATRMSFEFYGAFKSLSLLRQLGASTDQAEAVAEAIIRHQDLGVVGKITLLGQIIQLATIYDNVGAHPTVENFGELLHYRTRADVNRAFPREGWLSCFAATIREEEKRKPWCHSTHIEDFAGQISRNSLDYE